MAIETLVWDIVSCFLDLDSLLMIAVACLAIVSILQQYAGVGAKGHTKMLRRSALLPAMRSDAVRTDPYVCRGLLNSITAFLGV